jgi:hypothetical protein
MTNALQALALQKFMDVFEASTTLKFLREVSYEKQITLLARL